MYWTPWRDQARWYWHRWAERLDAEERDRQQWISDVKQRLGIVCFGDEPPAEKPPYWPDLPEGVKPEDYRLVSEHAMVSYDGVNFYVKPDGMTMAEFLDSLP